MRQDAVVTFSSGRDIFCAGYGKSLCYLACCVFIGLQTGKARRVSVVVVVVMKELLTGKGVLSSI